MDELSYLSRRNFLRGAALTSGAMMTSNVADAAVNSPAVAPAQHPNVLMICADQFRADFVGANGENPSVKTPNLDALAARGTNFRQAVCNQPLCSPSRASFLTGVYATEAKVWKLGLELNHSLPTIASTLKGAGYTTAFIGKWHVSAETEEGKGKVGLGWIAPGPSRGGFDDLWEGANVVELTSHPYEGNYWDTAGNDIGFKDEYRVDFFADRAVRFLEQKHDRPWLLFLSQLEPHQQNDIDAFVPPRRYADDFSWQVYRSQLETHQQNEVDALFHPERPTYTDPFVPYDLRNLPGNWRSHLPGYYGCVQAIDDCVGRVVETLQKTGQLDNTIIVFFSDHGCTFRTRLGEYKRSPHESSLRVPFIVAGPGFDRATVVNELVSLIDLTPTLLDGAGVSVPVTMKGKSLKKLANDPAARRAWTSEAYVQISSSICGRAIRTKEWTYCAYDPTIPHGRAEFSTNYTDFALYSLTGDPYEQVNLVGRPEYKNICDQLREKLKQMIIANGEPEPAITPMLFYA